MVSTTRRGICRSVRPFRSSEDPVGPPVSVMGAPASCHPHWADACDQRKVSPRHAATPSAGTTDAADKPSSVGWIKYVRSEETHELAKDAAALGLMAIIALRARWRSGFDVRGLEVGDALIGDYENIGLTRQEYRTRVSRLEKWGLITTRATNKGTIATLNDRTIFDVCAGTANQRGNQPATNRQPASNH